MKARIESLLALYERRTLTRRGLIEALAAVAAASGPGAVHAQDAATPVVRGRTLNHVTIATADVARSKAFYSKLAGLPVREEGPGFCELQLGNAFLGLYEPWRKGQRFGIDHVCLGIEGYQPATLLKTLQDRIPEARPSLEFDEQVYVQDPDGATIQFADLNYKRAA